MNLKDQNNGLPEVPDETPVENEMAEMTDSELFKQAIREALDELFPDEID